MCYFKYVFIRVNADYPRIRVNLLVHGDKGAGAAGDINDRAWFTIICQLDHLGFEILLPAGKRSYSVIKPVQEAISEGVLYFCLISRMFVHG